MKSIKVMPDYDCFPLWAHGNNEVGNIDPASLPISNSLISRLNEWAAEYDKTLDQNYPPNSGFQNKEAEVKFVIRGYSLAKELKAELNSIEVIYYDIDNWRERVL